MSDDTKPNPPTLGGLSGAEDRSWTGAGDTSGPDKAPLLLGVDALAKKSDDLEPMGFGSDEPAPGTEETVEPSEQAPRRGFLARVLKRGRSGPVEEPEPAPEEERVALIEEEPVPDPEGSAQVQCRGLFRRKKVEPQPVAFLEDDADLSAEDRALPDDEAQDPQPSEVMIPPGPSAAPRKIGRGAKRGFPPIQVLIGWIGESSRKDVIEHARGFAEDHIETLDTAWIAMAEFRGGTLFEIHEGGSGQAYLPELIEQLSRDPEQVLWVPSGTKLNRVVTFSLSEGRPFSMMLNEVDSARVRDSGQAPVERSGKMRRLSSRGTSVLVVGATLFAIGLSAMSASAFLASSIDQQPLPTLSYNPEILPHGQIVSLSSALRDDRWVSRIVFENGAWRAEFETFDELALPENTDEAQRLIDEATDRDAILQQERDRKIEELMSE